MSPRPGLARLRSSLLAVCAFAFGACNGADRLTNATDDLPDATLAQPLAPAGPSFADVSTGGIAFGFFHMPTSDYGTTYTGALRGLGASSLISELETARKAGARVMISLVGADVQYKNADGTFSLDKWKGRLGPFKNINLAPYVADGTIIAHYLIDEPNDPSNWAGTLVSRGMLDTMAMYSKQLWPTMPTAVRSSPTYLKGYPYKYLDAGWAQYHSRFGNVSTWLAKIVADAKGAGLALVTGVNTIAGGNATEGLPGFYLNTYALTAGQLQTAGSTILAEPYGCAFLSWRYNVHYQARADIQAVLANLSTMARNHPARTCKGGAQSTPPPPSNQPPTAAFTAPTCAPGVPCQFSDGSSDADGTIATWSWIFGDGKSASAKNPTNTFAAAGPYTVTLTVTDDKGAPKSVSQSLTVGSGTTNTSPTAAFTAPTCTVGVPCPLTDGSTDADGTIASWSWTLGNGSSSTLKNPTPTYATAGPFTVALTVTDDKGKTNTVSKSVTVSQTAPSNQLPTATFIAPSCTVGVVCQFNDGSTDTDGTIASRSWAFGDGGTSALKDPTLTYTAANTYTVTLTVTDDKGGTNSTSKSVTVTPAPQPNGPLKVAFTAPGCSPTVPCPFTDASSDTDGKIMGWKWVLGNGKISSIRHPTPTYATSGAYTVTLTVTDDKGRVITATKSVTVGSAPPSNQLPAAAFTAASCTAGAPCQFTDGSTDADGTIATRSWTFGDGGTSALKDPAPTYATAGPFTVTLTVTDNKGGTNSVSKSVTVVPVTPSNQLPAAAFTAASCTVGVPCQFTDGSTDADGTIATRSWTFGDGGSSTLKDPTPTYAAAGPFTVTLTVTDNKGAPNSVSKSVTVAAASPSNQPPTAAFTVSSCTAGSLCKFTDGSSDADGTIASRSWAFGNATSSTEVNPSVAYAAQGSFTVVLTVTDDKGKTGSVSKTVAVAPAAATNTALKAAFTTPACSAGVPCQFTDGSTDRDGKILSWTWALGNGKSSSVRHPRPTYPKGGTYTATLTVNDTKGRITSVSKGVTVTAPNSPPTAAFVAPGCTAGAACKFTDGSSDTDGSIAAWSWAFGNGTSSTGASPSATYTAAGSYDVTLTVTDDKGAPNSVTQSVTVASANTAPTPAFAAPSCTAGASCQFNDGSSDGDGTIASHNWTFGNGTSSSQTNPSVTYAAPGPFDVTLTVTDDDGATRSISQSITVASPVVLPAATPIVLSVNGWVKDQRQNMTLTWTGGAGSTLDVYRNGVRLTNTLNDKRYTNTRNYQKPATYTYKLCESGTTQCSNSATATFR